MGKSINDFLKNTPDKWLLMLLFFVVFGAYLWNHADFLGQLAQTIVGAILGIIGVRRLQNVDASTESGDVVIPPDSSTTQEVKE
jgi:hypothetical protein